MDERLTPNELKPLIAPRWLSTPGLDPVCRSLSARHFEPLPDPSKAEPFLQALKAAAERWSDLVAVSDDEQEMCYSALWRSVQCLAAEIRDNYPGRAPIGILLPSSVLYVVAVFACLAVGRIAVLLDEAYPIGRNRDIAKATGLSLLLVRAKSYEELLAPVLDVASVLQAGYHMPPPIESCATFDEPAFILCTSGSTGQPKAIVHSQATMFHWARTTHNALHICPDDYVLSLSSMSSLGGFTSLLSYPLAGARQEMFNLKSRGISGLLEILTARPVTILRTAPSTLRSLCLLPEIRNAFSRLRVVQTYGEPLTRADAAMIRGTISPDCCIRTTYGATECSGFSWFADPSDAQHPIYEPAGLLMPDTEAAIVDDAGQPCAPGEAGELIIRSRYNALGEWIDGSLVTGRLQPDLDDPTARIYHTGDMARVDANGIFVVLGRKDRMLKINGQRLEPAEIEVVLRDHEEVERAEVVLNMEASRPALIAFVIPTSRSGPDLTPRLKAMLRSKLPSYMIPGKVVLVSSIPLLPSGKVDGRSLLGDLARETSSASADNDPA